MTNFTLTEVVLITCAVSAVPFAIFAIWTFLLDLRKPPPIEVDAETLRDIASRLHGLSAMVARMAESQERPKPAAEESRGSPPGTPRAWASR